MTELQPEIKEPDHDTLPHFNLQTKFSSKNKFSVIIFFPILSDSLNLKTQKKTNSDIASWSPCFIQ